MRVRHRIPSIFNLSMVDVLCCSLGCVILLWLINLRDAKQHEDDSGLKLHDLTSQIADLEKQRSEVQSQADAQAAALRELDQKWKDATGRVASLQADVESREKDLADARGRAADVSRKLADAGGRIKDLQALADLLPDLRSQLKTAKDQYAADETKVQSLEKDAVRRAQDLDDTIRKLLASQKEVTQRSQDVDDAARKLLASQKEVAQRTQDLDDVGKKFAALQLAKAKVETDLEDRGKELALLRPYKEKYAADEEQVLSLKKDLDAGRKDLAEAKRNADALQTEKVKWQDAAARARAEADNRFAGITLTGHRVVFLVDMSGSMVYLDDNTPAPQKWAEVRNTVGRIMRSLPELEKYQVVTFSEKPHFPLGSDGKWLDYDPKSSVDLVLQTLADVKPEGGTNMYSPMEAVFRLRKDGLDAIYLLSDGLPNLGEGVKPEEVEKLTESEREARLSAVIRKALKTDWNRDLDGKPRVHLNTVGFFYESPDVGAFLWALARENDGSFVGMSKP